MLLIAFGLKAAVFPLFFWLPDSYPTARSPVTAVFAGLLTKVGVYAIIRTQTLLFAGRAQRPAAVGRRAHDDRRRARRHRPERREADPVVPHRQPDRLHGLRHRHRRTGGDRRDRLLPPPPDPDQDVAVPRRGDDRALDGHQPARSPQRARPPVRRSWPCCSCCRRSACRASRRSRASSPSSA